MSRRSVLPPGVVGTATFLLLAVALSPVAAQSLVLYGATSQTSTMDSFFPGGSLYTVDTVTGAATFIGPLRDSLNNSYGLTGLAYQASTDTLFGSTGRGNSGTNGQVSLGFLVKVDRASGQVI